MTPRRSPVDGAAAWPASVEDLLEAAPDVAYAVDDDRRLRWWNDRLTAVTGYADARLRERDLLDLVADRDRGHVRDDLATVLADGATVTTTAHLRTGDGTEERYEFTGGPVGTDAAEVVGVVGIGREATQRRDRGGEGTRRRDDRVTLDRINRVVRGVGRAVVRASTRDRLDQAVADRLAAGDAYPSAWVARYERATDRLRPVAWAGMADGHADRVAAVAEDVGGSRDPTARAVRTGDVAVAGDLYADPALAAWRPVATELGVRSLAAVPLAYDDACHGLAVVHASAPHGFTRRERRAFADLGETVGHAVTALERKRALASDTVTELELSVTDRSHVFVAATATTDATIDLAGVVPRDGATFLAYVTVVGDHEPVFDLAADRSWIRADRVVRRTDAATTCEFTVTGRSILTALADHGATVTAMSFADGAGTVVAEVPGAVAVRRVVEALRSVYPETTAVAQRESTPPTDPTPVGTTPLASLTEKQRTAVRAAYHAGYFDRPRSSTGEEIADSLGVSASTYHQHLRVGLSKLLDRFVGDDPGGDGGPGDPGGT